MSTGVQVAPRRTHQYSPAIAKRGLRYRGTSTKRTRSSCKINILERLDLRKWDFVMPYTYVHTWGAGLCLVELVMTLSLLHTALVAGVRSCSIHVWTAAWQVMILAIVWIVLTAL